MSICGLSRWLIAMFAWAALIGSAAAQAQPTKKGPVPPPKGPVPPTAKGPVPPLGRPVAPVAPVAPTPKTGPVAPAAPTAPGAQRPAGNSKIPEPEDVTLTSKDGLSIRATYYPSTAKKEAVPVIMVHDIAGQRGDFHALGLYLQGLGHAAIAPDLRGHGQSKPAKGTTSVSFPDPDKMNRGVLESMTKDIQACKAFLLEKNNAGELNIEKLCVVGAEFGATLAVRFAAEDWSVQNLPSFKLGQDVKALVLLSPQAPYKAVGYREALPIVQNQLSYLIVCGSEDPKSSAEAGRLHKHLLPHHNKNPEELDLYFVEPPTKLSGTKLLGRDLDIKDKIGMFIQQRLVKSSFSWQDRSGP